MGIPARLAADEKLLFCVDLSHFGSICTKLTLADNGFITTSALICIYLRPSVDNWFSLTVTPNRSILIVMKKTTLYFWLDLLLFTLLAITLLAASVEVFFHFFLHVVLGLLLSASALTHVALHWEWIKNAFGRFEHLPEQVRTNLLLNLTLFLAYSLCGALGLTARTLWLIFPPLHVVIGFVHVLLALLVITLQIIHLIRHWKWLTSTAQRVFNYSTP